MDDKLSLLVPYAFQVYDDQKPNKRQNWNCYSCGQEFVREDQLMTHFRRNKCRNQRTTAKATKNGNNGGTFTDLKKIINFNRKDVSGYECEICLFQYRDFSTFFEHLLEKHSPVVEKITKSMYECHSCKRVFAEYGTLKIHMRRHTGYHPFHCGKCGKRFMRLKPFQRHFNTHK